MGPFSGRRAAISSGALLVLSLAVWSPGLVGPFQFDDHATPLNDPASHSIAAWIEHLPVTLRPLTKLTYAVEASAGLELEPAPRRAVSIVLHGVAATLLLLLVLRLEPRLGWHGAFLVAAVWLVHPVHADSVMAVSGRSALLGGLLLLAALLAMETRRPILSAVLFALACLSRETVLGGALPLAVLATTRPGTTARRRWLDVTPLAIAGLAALAWVLTTPRYLALAQYSLSGRPVAKSAYAQVGAVPVGLELLVRPSRLSVDYGVPLPAHPLETLFVTGVVLLAAAATGVVLASARGSRTVAIGLALWLAALLPSQSLIPKLDPLTNRPLSLALAGLLVAATGVGVSFFERRAWYRPPDRQPAVVPARVASGACLVLVALLAVAAAGRSRLYRSELSLWADAAAKSRSNARPHLNYAVLLKEEGRNLEAWEVVSAAHAIDPFSSRVAALWETYRPAEEER